MLTPKRQCSLARKGDRRLRIRLSAMALVYSLDVAAIFGWCARPLKSRSFTNAVQDDTLGACPTAKRHLLYSSAYCERRRRKFVIPNRFCEEFAFRRLLLTRKR